MVGQGQLLVLAHWLLPRLHAALCAGPDGHDAAPPAHPRPELAAAAARCGGWGHRHFLRHSLPDRAALCQHPHAREPSRPDRRPVEWPNPGVGDLLASAGLQLCRAAPRRDDRRVLADEEEGTDPWAAPWRTRL